MFVEAHIAVPMSLADACEAFAEVLRSREFHAHSADAYAEGLDLLLRVGPRGSASGLSKQVQVHLLEERISASTHVFPLRWEATGASGRLFPALDANLGLTPSGEGSTLLSIIGRYEPPLGALGKRLDRAMLARVAEATTRSLLRRLAAMITVFAEARRTGEELAAAAHAATL
jgi:hypothetical protein